MAVAILVSFMFLAAIASTQLAVSAVSAVFPLAGNQTGEELRQLIVSGSNESIFVCSGGHLYQLSSQLEEMQSVPAEGCIAMSGTNDGNWLVLCFDNNTCALYPTSDLSVINSTFSNLSFYQSGGTVTVLGSSPDLDSSFYVAAAEFENDSNLQLLQRGFVGVQLSRDFDSGSSNSLTTRKVQHGFHYRDHSYFLSVVHFSTNNPPPQLTITRVCNSDKERFSAVQERTLRSGSGTQPIVTGVSLIDNTLIVSFDDNVLNFNMIDMDDDLDLFFQLCLIVQHNALSNAPFSGGMLSCSALAETTTNPSLCNFNSSDESLILTLFSSPPINITPLNRVVTSSLVITLESFQFLFVGVVKDFQHFVEKYLFQMTTPLLYDIPVSSEVTGLIQPPGANHVYATAGNQIVSLPLEICSEFNTCTSCVTNGDPLCGWCSIERKCSRSIECKNFDHTKRYIRQGQQSNCTDSVMVNRDDFNTNNVVRLSFMPAIPPPTLSGEEFLCVFSNTEHEIMFNTTLSTDDFTCNLTLVTPQLTEIKLTTNFSLFSNLTNTVFLTRQNAFTFYNCSLGTSCSICVETEGNCGWSPYNFTCSLQSSDDNSSSSVLTVSTDQQSYVEVCPVLNPASLLLNSERNYVQQVPVLTLLVINVTNIPVENGSIFYQCQLGEVVVPANVINSSLSCDMKSEQMAFNLKAATGKEAVPLNVLLTSGDSNYTLDTSTGETVNVVFYKCSVLAVGCSSCLAQRLNTGFQCGWCEASSTCKDYSENCSSVFNIMSNNCDLPMITMIHPISGPTTGGTKLTITGSDLGVEATDILSITVGNLTCHLNEDEYIAGRSIVCNIQNSTSSQAKGNVSVVVTVRRNNESEIVSSQFQFKEPSVLSVFPMFGPAAGETIVKVRGLNLNIGNKERTRVFLNSDELVSCAIISISSAEICCRWESFNTTTGMVHVSIDGTLVWNSSVTYQYLNNPVYEQVTPRNTIISGGIKLNFTGRFLNVSHNQRFVVNNGEATGLCGLEGSTDTTLVCLAPRIPSNIRENINYTIAMDGAPGPDLTTISLQIDLNQDPEVTEIIDHTVFVNRNNTIEISGNHMRNVEENEIQVLVGNDTCTVQSTLPTMINCLAPLRDTPVSENVLVKFGKYLNISAGQLNYTSSPSQPNSDTIIISTVVPVVIIVIVVIVILIICFYYCTIIKYRGKLQRAQQPIYMLPEISVMKMTDNVVYHTSKFAGRDAEPHLYEELPDNVDEQRTQSEGESAMRDDDSHTYDEPPENDDELQTGDKEKSREEEQMLVDQEGEGDMIATRADEQEDVLIAIETDEGENAQESEENPAVVQNSGETDQVEDTAISAEQQASKVELQSPSLPAAEDSKKEPNAEDDQNPGQFSAEDSKNAEDDQSPGLLATDDFSEECDDYYVNEEPSSREITVHLQLLFQ